MGYETGAVKWIVGMLLTPVGYASLYIFGDGIWNTITHFRSLLYVLQAPEPHLLVHGLIKIYFPTPETLIESLILYPAVGGIVGALLWYQAVKF
jgi:hypothetical protein